MMIKETYPVKADDMTCAGDVSARIKRHMKRLGIPSSIMRRVSVCTYEAEINLVIHSDGGQIDFEISEDRILVRARDVGPGIPDIDKAMTEGWSTASNEVRNMGFGAGMGLPNMKRNADEFAISSVVGEGTDISMIFHI
ncbi:MAG: ATP-binding protein [Clostridiales bacterium]|nr:ATP-binding protein [Clostridiales bacterium]MDY3763144.1 ATP-binding protein [Candidatus Ventricola sp.]MCI6587563.1 ATP-binding protein [Clostridiales bacterium]MCI7704087.1 ATP-binding protein [Clostridiales bacterium]MDY3832672.1 ATP-binding protein [Candidatus Ventricola sp.]